MLNVFLLIRNKTRSLIVGHPSGMAIFENIKTAKMITLRQLSLFKFKVPISRCP